MIKKKVLLIDDSPTVLSILQSLFEQGGYDVVTAENGQKGVERAGLAIPDIAVIDTLMPDMDGFEVCRQIKRLPQSGSTKIIVMTGSVDAIDALKARRMGADDYVVKTSDFQLLLDTAKQLTGV